MMRTDVVIPPSAAPLYGAELLCFTALGEHDAVKSEHDVCVAGVSVSGVCISDACASGVCVSGVFVSGVCVSDVCVSGVSVSGICVSGVCVSGVCVSGVCDLVYVYLLCVCVSGSLSSFFLLPPLRSSLL